MRFAGILAGFAIAASLPGASVAWDQAPAVLLKDINEQLVSYGVQPEEIVDVQGTAFFRGCADDGTTGCELWKSNGTASGTVLVKDIAPGSVSSSPSALTNVYGTLFFRVGSQLWKSDGTAAGTVLLKGIQGYYGPQWLTNVNGNLFFAVGGELWMSDGTAAGTVLVDNMLGELSDLTNVNGTLFFKACFRETCEIWKSYGPIFTARVKDIGPIRFPWGSLVNVNGTLFFTACSEGFPSWDCELWKSDGTEAGTFRVKDIVSGSEGSYPNQLTEVGGTLFFTACAPDQICGTSPDRVLWKSDGTEAGTVVVKDSPAVDLTNVSGTLYFNAAGGLWKTDGSPTGTVLLKTISAGSLTNVNGKLFFVSGSLLWKSDGTATGTAPVSPQFVQIGELASVGGTLLFRGCTGDGAQTQGCGLWRSDSSAAGTFLVTADLSPGTGASSPSLLTRVDGTLFFTAYDGLSGWMLWKSDGTEAGTVLVKDIGASSLTNVNGTLFFMTGTWLWKSDGTEAGTVLVRNLSYSVSGVPSDLTELNGTLFFTAGLELWKSDGTEAGTVPVAEVPDGGGPGSSGLYFLTNADGVLFFLSCTSYYATSCELWTSDGTRDGTALASPDIVLLWEGDLELASVSQTLFFPACSSTFTTCGLWKSDGTEAGTQLLKNLGFGFFSNPPTFANLSGTLFFTADDGLSGRELWKSDGTAVGTVLVKDIVPGSGSSSPSALTNVNGRLFFSATGGLWKSDGTEAGTNLVKAIGASSLTNGNGTLFFVANEGASGEELWKSDGTEAGTMLLADLVPGSGGSLPKELTPVGPALLFSAIGEGIGRELWMLPIPEPDALPLGVASIGGLAALARRRRRARSRVEAPGLAASGRLGRGWRLLASGLVIGMEFAALDAGAAPVECPFVDPDFRCQLDHGDSALLVLATDRNGGAVQLSLSIGGSVELPLQFFRAYSFEYSDFLGWTIASATVDSDDRTVRVEMTELSLGAVTMTVTVALDDLGATTELNEAIGFEASTWYVAGRFYVVTDFNLNGDEDDDTIVATSDGTRITQSDLGTTAVSEVLSPVPDDWDVAPCCSFYDLLNDSLVPLLNRTSLTGPADFHAALSWERWIGPGQEIVASIRQSVSVPEPRAGSAAAAGLAGVLACAAVQHRGVRRSRLTCDRCEPPMASSGSAHRASLAPYRLPSWAKPSVFSERA